MAFKQGDLNGLCGIYAVVNALHSLLEIKMPRQFSDHLFEVVASAIPRNQYPDVLWEGMDTTTILRLSRSAARHLKEMYDFDVKVWSPFQGHNFDKLSECFDTIQEIWALKPAIFIFGIQWAGNDKGGHWTVLNSIDSGEIGFLDSTGTRRIRRRSLALSGVTKNRVEPNEIIGFELLSVGGERVVYA